jgi:hypothetical protein
MRQLIQFDFVAGQRQRSPWGQVLLGVGLIAAIGVAIEYRTLSARRAGLEQRVATLARLQNHPNSRAEDAAEARDSVSIDQAARDLATPWTELLAELEQASKDTEGQVSLLGIEPDHGKHSVRINAEARTLALALAYVQRLQASHSLKYPMLDRHEIRADDAQHPVRFEMTGDWKDQL